MNIPALQAETLDLYWMREHLEDRNKKNPRLGEAMGLVDELIKECNRRGGTMSAEKIFSMDINEAMKYKWVKGIQEYRDGNADAPFVGDPIIEMYSEIVDALVYADVAEEMNGWELYDPIYEILTNVAMILKAYRRKESNSQAATGPKIRAIDKAV
jgi:hypothetical protein